MKRFAICGLALVMTALLGVLLFEGGAARSNAQTGAAQAEAQTADAGNSGSAGVLLVNRTNPLPEGYAPAELVNLYEQPHSFRLASSDILLERVAYEAANEMFGAAERDGVNGFIITSGYRTQEKQTELYQADTNGTAAAPGTSEHQSGLAFDVTAYRDGGGFEGTQQFSWLIENCWDYGFILRYPEGREDVTGFSYEPWHYRYVGWEIAEIIHEKNWTLEEYCAEA